MRSKSKVEKVSQLYAEDDEENPEESFDDVVRELELDD